MKRLPLVMVPIAAALLSGCFFGGSQSCNKVQEYQSSNSVKPIEVPAGLEAIEDPNKLVIPPGEKKTQPAPKGQPCPDEPPDYFDTDPV